MGGHMDHSLVNPNQLRHYGTKVQDNPVSDRALSIITENNDFCMELAMAVTVVYADIFTPSDKELHECPHIILSLPHTWDPPNVSFPKPRGPWNKRWAPLGMLVRSTTMREQSQTCLLKTMTSFLALIR